MIFKWSTGWLDLKEGLLIQSSRGDCVSLKETEAISLSLKETEAISTMYYHQHFWLGTAAQSLLAIIGLHYVSHLFLPFDQFWNGRIKQIM